MCLCMLLNRDSHSGRGLNALCQYVCVGDLTETHLVEVEHVSCQVKTLTGNPNKWCLRFHAIRRIHPITKCSVIACQILITYLFTII